MTTKLDELAPRYLGEDRIDLRLDVSQVSTVANQSILLTVDFERTMPQGVVLPLVFEVQGPSPQSYQRRVLTRLPHTIIFTPREGGPHFVGLREAAHNRWWGSLHLAVVGEQLEVERPV